MVFESASLLEGKRAFKDQKLSTLKVTIVRIQPDTTDNYAIKNTGISALISIIISH